MDEKVETFRMEVLRWRGSRRRGARPYTAVMKAKALQLAKFLQAQGLAMEVVAKRIGICAATLYLWRSSLMENRLVPVTVVQPEPQVIDPACLALVSPRGYRLEGVSVKMAVAMLQELG